MTGVITGPGSYGRNPALYSSATQHWGTPNEVYVDLHREFHFTLDPCPLGGGTDGLSIDWRAQRVYCNPPYGRTITDWLIKAHEAALAVYLLPARTDTRWWHDHALKASEIRFIKGRLCFKGPNGNLGRATFPSVVLVFKTAPGA